LVVVSHSLRQEVATCSLKAFMYPIKVDAVTLDAWKEVSTP
jgi:hypothetical protein